MTKQRKLVLAIINESERHLTAEEIFIEAKKRITSIAFATIYNNLNALVNEIEERYKKGQPVLVGTIAIETNELISTMNLYQNKKSTRIWVDLFLSVFW